MMRLLIVCGLVAFGVMSLPGPGGPGSSQVYAQSGDSSGPKAEKRLQRGEALYLEQEYAQAIRQLEPVISDREATKQQRLAALELIGLSYLILGDDKAARRAFEKLLAVDPAYELGDDTGSPKIRNFFAQVKEEAGRSAELEHTPPEQSQGGRRAEIEVTAGRNAVLVKEVVLMSRRAGASEYQPTPMAPAGENRWRARLPLPSSRSDYDLVYYIEGRDLGGRVVARIGDAVEPLRLDVAAGQAPSAPWYRRWYVIAAGAAVIGAGVGGVVLLSGDDDPSLGRVTLTP